MIHERLYKKGEIVTLEQLHKLKKADVPVKGFIRTRRGHMEHVDPFYRHQLNIARKTLSMTPEMARVMGGMTLDEAKAFMDKHNEAKRKRAREGRRAREDAYRSAGLKKVKGALGGTYWE